MVKKSNMAADRIKPANKDGQIEPYNREKVKQAFLDTYGRCYIIQTACDAAGINRNTFYKWRKAGYISDAEMAECLEKWQDVLREEILKVGIVGVQQPLVHNGRIVLESDGRKAFINKRDNHVLTQLAERYLPEWQQAKKVDIITHEGIRSIADIPEQYALVLDTRLLTQEEFTYLRNIAAGYDERKQQQGKNEEVAIVIESEVTNG
jgi:hypothetical protein